MRNYRRYVAARGLKAHRSWLVLCILQKGAGILRYYEEAFLKSVTTTVLNVNKLVLMPTSVFAQTPVHLLTNVRLWLRYSARG